MKKRKKCPYCGIEKSSASFHTRIRRGKKDLAAFCKVCRKIYIHNHYIKNKAKYVERAKRRTRAVRDYIDSVKTKTPCVDCGNSYHPVVMEFDHIGTDKTACVSKLAELGNLDKVKMEIDKCELVCANCHRMRTLKRGQFKNSYWC